MMPSPLRWVGGKSRLRERIIERFCEHRCYVEVFCGAGWVLFGKPAETSRAEVINDVDGELINFYRVLKHRPAEFAESFHHELISRQLFNEYRRFEDGKTELERAMRFYYVLRLCFGGRREERCFGTSTTAPPGINLSRLYFHAQQFSGRLERVVIENLSWEKCLAVYDRDHTLFYLDPPYPSTRADDYLSRMTWEQHEALAETLRGLRGRWVLSYQDHPRIRALYRGSDRRGRRLRVEKLGVTYSMGNKSGQGNRVKELLIRNF